MTSKDLKRLSRRDLLEMLLELSKENEQLRQEVKELQKQLDDRCIAIENCGSLAEAALQLNGVFQAAQAACDQYIENIKFQYMERYRQSVKKESNSSKVEYVAMNESKREILVGDILLTDEDSMDGKDVLLRELKSRRDER